ncbi:hypothetical protein G3G77_001998 [Salmonella enterica]|nr:hypothetical protein [Salmonella enterica]EEH5466216.1 hypothetical protein [Salmonella enterica]EEH7553413.1 hypothetical protein [Salmonella enterica]EEO5637639.1 hypothetical protein [Salmonella enterica]EEQ0200560.1 hypothetical protein [Salmonella enterica]
MVRKLPQTTELPILVQATVRHDLSVDFRGMNFSLRGIPDLVSERQVTITHYDWHTREITVSFTDVHGVTHRYIADDASPEQACA